MTLNGNDDCTQHTHTTLINAAKMTSDKKIVSARMADRSAVNALGRRYHGHVHPCSCDDEKVDWTAVYFSLCGRTDSSQ